MINTVAVNYDSNPSMWLSDPRVQMHLPRGYTLDFVNLLHYAMKLSAIPDSFYVDGEFSYATALVMVPGLTPEGMDAISAALLAKQVDGDRWVVDFITAQTSHEALVNSAAAKARGGKTRNAAFAAEKLAKSEDEAKAQHRREKNAEYQRAHRERSDASNDAEEHNPADDAAEAYSDPVTAPADTDVEPDWAAILTPKGVCIEPDCDELRYRHYERCVDHELAEVAREDLSENVEYAPQPV